MKILPIPKEDQMRAMLDSCIFDLLRDYGIEPERVDYRKYITVRRQDLIDFLSVHPEIAERYFQKFSTTKSNHDVEVIRRDSSEFVTAWMDHGQPRSMKRFKTLSEAVAEHILVTHGMY